MCYKNNAFISFCGTGLLATIFLTWMKKNKNKRNINNSNGEWCYENPRGSELAHFLKMTRLYINIYTNFVCNTITSSVKYICKIFTMLSNVFLKVFKRVQNIYHHIIDFISPITPYLQLLKNKFTNWCFKMYEWMKYVCQCIVDNVSAFIQCIEDKLTIILTPIGKFITKCIDYITQPLIKVYHWFMENYFEIFKHYVAKGINSICQQLNKIFKSLLVTNIKHTSGNCFCYVFFSLLYFGVWILHNVLKFALMIGPWIIALFLYIVRVLGTSSFCIGIALGLLWSYRYL